MASHKHHLSFTDHLALYLPHSLRPALPRDLRPPPPPVEDPCTPPPTPERHGSRERTSGDEEEPGTATASIHDPVSDQPKDEECKSTVRDTRSKRKSREGYHVSLILTNSGSVARDHLASERTFLAYVRTSLALASTGVGEHPPDHLEVFCVFDTCCAKHWSSCSL